MFEGNKSAKGKGLDNNPQNINRNGRPRKLVSDVLLEMRAKGIKPVSMDEIKDIYLSLVNNTQEELQEIAKDPNQPMLTKLIIQAMANKGKGFEVIERMFDRAIGKAVQRNEHSGKDGEPIEISIDHKEQKELDQILDAL